MKQKQCGKMELYYPYYFFFELHYPYYLYESITILKDKIREFIRPRLKPNIRTIRRSTEPSQRITRLILAASNFAHHNLTISLDIQDYESGMPVSGSGSPLRPKAHFS